MATKCFGLGSIFLLILTFLSCSMKKSIVGTYYHEKLGLNYTLELRADDTFIQTLIKDNVTFTNTGKYNISLNIVSPSPWKSKNELLTTPIDKGGCFGCELKYKRGKLYYYTDPDDLPEDIFLKMDK